VEQAHAFRRAFACDPPVLEAELRRYLRRLAFDTVTHELIERVWMPDFSSEVIHDAEARTYLAELLARHQRTDEAHAMLEGVLAAEPGSPRALAGLGRLHVRNGLVDEGLPLLERAAALAPGDAAIVAVYGRALVDQLRSLGPFEHPDRGAVERARAVLARAAELNRDDAYVVAMRGLVELLAGDLDRARAYLEQAIARDPVRDEYELLLARALVQARDQTRAEALLMRLSTRGGRPEIREQAQQLTERLAVVASPDDRPAEPPPSTLQARAAESDTDAGRDGERGAEAGRGPRVRADPALVTIGGRQVHLLLRAVEPGETRVLGVVDRIECRASSAVLHVRVQNRVLRLNTASLDGVELTNFQGGPMPRLACGTMTRPLPGLVTYRAVAGDPAGDGDAVALEIVPPDFAAP
jgi:Tfp pilus assembly protein PilF